MRFASLALAGLLAACTREHFFFASDRAASAPHFEAPVLDASIEDTDAFVASDAALDPIGCECVASSPCTFAFCERGACVELPHADGLSCGGADICVDGACVARTGCGDGYREPGPEPAREACDDGNSLEGDACSPACAPETLAFASEGDAIAPGPVPAVGVDRRGRALLVWIEPSDGGARIWGVRLDRGGRALGEVALIAEPSIASAVAVTGVRFGWLVAYTDAGVDQSEIFVRRVDAGGAVGGPRRANEHTDGRQDAPRLAQIRGGAVLVWRDEGASGESRIAARLFGEDGARRAPELTLTEGSTADLEPSVDADEENVFVAWTRAAKTAVVMGRAFDAALAPRGDAIELGSGFGASVGATEGSFAIAWTTRTGDTRGDLAIARVDAAGTLIEGPSFVATDAPELAASVVLSARGPMLVYARGEGVVGRVRDLALATDDFALPSEGEALRDRLALPSVQSAGSIARAHDGFWLVWNDDETGRTEVRAHRLAIDEGTP
jgi:cysteine-rich repeat protein